MADNVELNAGSGGSVIATDDDGTAHHQYVKLEFGADNTQTKVTSSAGLPVTPDSGGFPVTNAGTFVVQIDGDALTALQLIDDAVAAEGAALGKGVLIQGDDGTDRTNVLVDTDGHLQVDVLNTSLAVTNAGLTELAAAINTNRLDVNIAAQASDITIADGGNVITVDGTVTANLSATDNAVLDTIDAVLDTINAKLASGTVIGDVNLGATDNAVLDQIETNTSGSTSHYRNIDANAEAAIKGSAGTLRWLHAMNLTAAKAYLHLYDATTGNVIPGTTTPDFTFPIATQGDTNGAGFVLPAPIEFANAITLVVTTTLDGSAGDPGTNGVVINAGYT